MKAPGWFVLCAHAVHISSWIQVNVILQELQGVWLGPDDIDLLEKELAEAKVMKCVFQYNKDDQFTFRFEVFLMHISCLQIRVQWRTAYIDRAYAHHHPGRLLRLLGQSHPKGDRRTREICNERRRRCYLQDGIDN